MLPVLLLFALGSVLGLSVPSQRQPSKCGYESCTAPKEGVLNVHIVPHTHDDVGWLKTVDQYYYGNRNNIQKAGVQYILDSVIKELWADPERRFIYVETAFFSKWWHEQSPTVQSQVRTLVQEGRLKFAGGAWSMNDEATTHYQSTIDQFTYGLGFLNATFGDCGRPRVGWQIDPFGHSREFASLLAGMGYDGLFLGRIDYQDKVNRKKLKSMEFLWRGDDDLGKPSDIFTCVLYNTYSPPPGFCFDILCSDDPIIDDPTSPDYNVDSRVSDFLKIAQNMSESYATNNLLVTMGEDFQYQLADMWYKNLDKLIKVGPIVKVVQFDGPYLPYSLHSFVSEFIKYVQQQSTRYVTNNVIVTMGGDFTYQEAGMWYKNLDKLIKYGNKKAKDENLKINMFYSTPDCYLKAVKDANPVLPIKQDDFFPYASDPHSYWTGYFTSRPTIKFIEAEANRYTQMAKQLFVLAGLPMDKMSVLDKLKSAMGVLQHHDAITGTEKQHVTYDYIRLIAAALHDVHDTITTTALNKMININKQNGVYFNFDRCQFNESSCFTSENARGNMIVTVYNPLAWSVTTPVAIPISRDEQFEAKDNSGKTYPVQTYPLLTAIKDLPLRNSKATHEALFIAQIPPLGYKSFYIQKLTRIHKRDVSEYELNKNDVEDDGNFDFKGDEMMSDDPRVVQRYPYDQEFGDEGVSSGVEAESSTLKTVLFNDKTYKLKFNAAYYPGFIGNNMIYENRSSGAYIFRPDAETPNELDILNISNIEGNNFVETRILMSDNAEFYFREYRNDKLRFGELHWVIGPITDEDGVGKEYVFRYESNIISNGEFYTDSNGRTVLKRKLNQRPQWNLTLEEPVAGNYYPLVDFAYIKDSNDKFSLRVLPDRPEGGASLQEGEIEVMLHRRLLHDDAFGVGEALNETLNGKGLVVKGTHKVFFDSQDFTFKDVLEMRNKPEVFISDAGDVSFEQWAALNTEKSWLKDNLDDGVNLLTLENWSENSFLIRLENYLDKSPKSLKKVDLDNILNNVKVVAVKEMILSADKLVTDHKPWEWRTFDEFAEDFNKDYGSFTKTQRAVDRIKNEDNGNKINLDAKQIRTFVVQYERL